jgi:hypothetical protein
LRIRVLIIALTWLSVCLSALASAADNKVELEVLVSNYEELAVDAKNCTDSRNQKSAPCTRFIEIIKGVRVILNELSSNLLIKRGWFNGEKTTSF